MYFSFVRTKNIVRFLPDSICENYKKKLYHFLVFKSLLKKKSKYLTRKYWFSIIWYISKYMILKKDEFKKKFLKNIIENLASKFFVCYFSLGRFANDELVY